MKDGIKTIVACVTIGGCYSGLEEHREVGEFDRAGDTPGRWQLSEAASADSRATPHIEIDGSPPGPHRESNCTGTFTAGANVLKDFVQANFPGVLSIGGYSCRAINGGTQTSIHGLGRAIDIHMSCPSCAANNLEGDPLAHWLIQHSDEIGIQRIIWDRSSWEPRGLTDTREYTGAHPHNDHLHVELNLAGSEMETSWFGSIEPPVIPPGPEVDLCGDVTEAGTCEGNTVVRCDGNHVREEACGDDATCGFHPDAGVTICKRTNRKEIVAPTDGTGYWIAAADGGVFSFETPFHGSLGGEPIGSRIIDMAAPRQGGYWLLAENGQVFPFGDVVNHGQPDASTLASPLVDIAAADGTLGYWIASADGGVFAYGSAPFHGSLPGLGVVPAQPIVAIEPTRAGTGYWLVSADGGVFGFGAAGYHGSLPELAVATTSIVDVAGHPASGYWLVDAAGAVFAFGAAQYHGGANNIPLVAPIVSIEATPSGDGYWLLAADGGVFAYGGARFLGAAHEG